MSGFTVTCAPGSVRLAGEIDVDAAADIVIAGTAALVGSQHLEIDLAAVTFLDSSALGAFVELRNTATDNGVTLVLTNVPARVHRIFDITGLNDVFEIGSASDVEPNPGQATM